MDLIARKSTAAKTSNQPNEGILMHKVMMATIMSVMFAGSAAIGSAPAHATASNSTSGLADCTYKVTKTTGVYEKPSRSSKRLKTEHRGDRVRGYSRLTYYNEPEHERYRAVDIKKARDDIGWIRADVLKLVKCDR